MSASSQNIESAHENHGRLNRWGSSTYSLGLLDVSNRVNPVGRAFAEVVAQARAKAPSVPQRREAVVVEVDENDVPLSRTTLAPGGTVVEAWYELRAAGHFPAVVTSTTAADPAVRGIEHLVRPSARV